jgi:hypothetical protein
MFAAYMNLQAESKLSTKDLPVATELPLVIGPVGGEVEMPFIYSSWLKSNRKSPMTADVRNDVYFSYHHRLIERLVERGATIQVAKSEGVIVGWICSEGPVLHYVYVKSAFRDFGVAKKLWHVVGRPTVCSHINENVRSLASKLTMIYNPYLV